MTKLASALAVGAVIVALSGCGSGDDTVSPNTGDPRGDRIIAENIVGDYCLPGGDVSVDEAATASLRLRELRAIRSRSDVEDLLSLCTPEKVEDLTDAMGALEAYGEELGGEDRGSYNPSGGSSGYRAR